VAGDGVVAGDVGVGVGFGVAVADDVGLGFGVAVREALGVGEGEAFPDGDGDGEAVSPYTWSEFATSTNSCAVRSPLMTTRQSPV
jgi:hypothetical protein